jgi:hypothetical protein
MPSDLFCDGLTLTFVATPFFSYSAALKPADLHAMKRGRWRELSFFDKFQEHCANIRSTNAGYQCCTPTQPISNPTLFLTSGAVARWRWHLTNAAKILGSRQHDPVTRHDLLLRDSGTACIFFTIGHGPIDDAEGNVLDLHTRSTTLEPYFGSMS